MPPNVLDSRERDLQDQIKAKLLRVPPGSFTLQTFVVSSDRSPMTPVFLMSSGCLNVLFTAALAVDGRAVLAGEIARSRWSGWRKGCRDEFNQHVPVGRRSEPIRKPFQIGNGGDQPLLCQDRQILFNALGRVFEMRPNFAQRQANLTWRERKLVPEEVTRAAALDGRLTVANT